MTHFDVFNGDADGICALHQLRLATPLDSVLVSGVKRDIALLQRVAAQDGDAVTVLDISAAVNRSALVALLDRGVRVEYFDHHFAGDLPLHAHLSTLIDLSPRVCTAMLVDRHLGHAATYLTYDLLVRRLEDRGHEVRLVRNITEAADVHGVVGHVGGDRPADRDAEDRGRDQDREYRAPAW